ncbi:hypothetical protein KEM54_001639 [Ascosphaera aggregata]|nr:hypothetical protein KEM54_001639 [Ascosphaera aggregata]
MASGVRPRTSISGFKTTQSEGKIQRESQSKIHAEECDDRQQKYGGLFHFVTVDPCSERQKSYNKSIVRSHASKRIGRPHRDQNWSALTSSLNASSPGFTVFPAGKRKWTSKTPKMRMRLKGVPNSAVDVQTVNLSSASPRGDDTVDESAATAASSAATTQVVGEPAVTTVIPEPSISPGPFCAPPCTVEPLDYANAKRILRQWEQERLQKERPGLKRKACMPDVELIDRLKSLYGFDYIGALYKEQMRSQKANANIDYPSSDVESLEVHAQRTDDASPGSLGHFRVKELLRYAKTQQWPEFLQNPEEQRTAILKEWWRVAQSNELAFSCCLFGAVAHQQVRQKLSSLNFIQTPEERLERSLYEGDAISQLRVAAAEPDTATSDETIFALLWISFSKVDYTQWHHSATASTVPFAELQWLNVYAGLTVNDMHMRAVRSLIRMKGGLEKIRLPGLAQALSLQIEDAKHISIDILVATKCYTRPSYSYFGIYPESAIGKTPGWPTVQPAWRASSHGKFYDTIGQCSLPKPLTEALRNIQDYTAVISRSLATGEALELSTIVDRRNYIQWHTVSLPDHKDFYDYSCKFEEIAYGPVLLRAQEVPDYWAECFVWGKSPSPVGSPFSGSSSTGRPQTSISRTTNDQIRFQPVSPRRLRSLSATVNGHRGTTFASHISQPGLEDPVFETVEGEMAGYVQTSPIDRFTPVSSPVQPRATGPLHLLLWVIVMGGIAADCHDRCFFMDVLCRTCKLADVTRWQDLRAILRSIAWIDTVCDGDAKPLWDEAFEMC